MTKFLKINYILLSSFVMFIATTGWAQVAVNTTGAAADASAMLDASSDSKGFLLPRMTSAQRDAIVSPAEGLIIFNTSTLTLDCYDGSAWTTPFGGFTCGTSRVADIDGNLIYTRLIGNQCWLASNLNTGIRIESSADPSDNGVIERYCYYDEDDTCAVYGGLYQWHEMMQYVSTEGAQGICPSGWRVPTADELFALVTFLGGENVAGGTLKMTGSRYWCSGNTAINSSGFTAFGSGYISTNQGMTGFHDHTVFWSSSLSGLPENGYKLSLDCNSAEAYFEDDGYTPESYSVRCIRINN